MTCSGYRTADYSLIWVILAVIAICALTIAGPFVNRLLQPINNDLIRRAKLQELETAFQDIQHPAGTEPVSTRSYTGTFAGQEQGCDFFVGEIRSYSDDQEVVLSTYSDQQVSGNPIHALLLENRQIPGQVRAALPESLNDLADWQIPADVGQQQLYMVYIIVQDYRESNCR